MRFVVVALSALLVAAPAAAQTNSNSGGSVRSSGSIPQGSSEAGEAENGERKTCRRIDLTGSRTAGRRVCMTDREWRAYDRNAGQ